MEIKFTNYTHKENKLNFEIKPAEIIGITGNTKEEIINLISLRKLNKGTLTIDNVKITKDKLEKYRKKIVTIEKAIDTYHLTIINLMNDYIKRNNLIIKDPEKKINDSLKIVSLDQEILEREIKSLSKSEQKLLQIAMSLLSNPEIIIIEDPFKFLDKQAEKKLITLFRRLKDQFNKTIIIVSDDSNILHKYTTTIFFIKNDSILLTGKTEEEYLKVDFLKKQKFEIPDIVEFTYLAKKKKQVKIDYHKDIRDIIKDIYRHI